MGAILVPWCIEIPELLSPCHTGNLPLVIPTTTGYNTIKISLGCHIHQLVANCSILAYYVIMTSYRSIHLKVHMKSVEPVKRGKRIELSLRWHISGACMSCIVSAIPRQAYTPKWRVLVGKQAVKSKRVINVWT